MLKITSTFQIFNNRSGELHVLISAFLAWSINAYHKLYRIGGIQYFWYYMPMASHNLFQVSRVQEHVIKKIVQRPFVDHQSLYR